MYWYKVGADANYTELIEVLAAKAERRQQRRQRRKQTTQQPRPTANRASQNRAASGPKGSLQITLHAQQRSAQRSLSLSDLRYVMQHGQLYRTSDAHIYYMRQVDLPRQDERQMARLVGAAVITCKAQAFLITAWRNRKNGLRNIRRKLAA